MARFGKSILERKSTYHKLKENKGSTLPDKILIIDTESNQKKLDNKTEHTLKIGWYCLLNRRDKTDNYTEKWKCFYNPEEICKEIDSMFSGKATGYIVGHNIFFDLQEIQFFYYFPKYKWRLRFWYEKGMTYCCILQRENTRIKIISTTNFFTTSLKSLGKIVGLNKMEIDFDKCTIDKLSEYCRNDVEITKRIFLKYLSFCKNNDLGKFSVTRASQSMHAFRHRFMNHKIVFHDDKLAIEHERKAYMGGRCEAFRIGKLPINRYVTLDINSMYPYIMKINPLPIKLVDCQSSFSIDKLKSMFKKYCMIAEVDIETDEPVYAYRTKEKIIYPIGKFRTYLCTSGLFYAWNNKHLKKIYRIQFYFKDFIFEKYIDYFWSLRQQYQAENNKLFDSFCKIFMNSLYGKLGQRSFSETYNKVDNPELYYRIENYFPDKHKIEIETCLMNTVINNGEETINKEALVAIPAHITEDARFLLWGIMKEIGLKHIIYCDTDSVKIKASKLCKIESLIENKMLGTLKLESIDKSLSIHGAKDYIADGKIKLKGVPLSSHNIEKNVYAYDNWGSQKHHLRLKENKVFIVNRIIKKLLRRYDKGQVNKYGIVSPIKL